MVLCPMKMLVRLVGAIRESDRGCSAQGAWYIRKHGRIEQVLKEFSVVFVEIKMFS